MKKKKILFIHNWMVCGGIERVLLSMFKYFDYSRFDVELLLLYRDGEFLDDLYKGVKVISLYSSRLSFLEKLNYNLLSRFNIDWGYRFMLFCKITGKYDVIVSFTGGYPLKYHTYITSKALKNISWLHTDMFNNHHTIGRFFSEAQEKEAYNKMDKIVFVSNDAKAQFEKLYPDIEISKDVIFNPIEKNLIVQYRKEFKKYSKDRCFNIVSIGRLCHGKGFDRLIRLAKRLKEDGYSFKIKIIGEGYDVREHLERLIKETHVEEYVFLLGFIDLPYEEMSNSDLFISSSLVEGFSLVLAEAFCLGLPVVSTKTTGPIELIDNDKYGILVDHDDESIYQGVKRMIDDDELRMHYHRMSLERAKIFNIEETMKQVFDVL